MTRRHHVGLLIAAILLAIGCRQSPPESEVPTPAPPAEAAQPEEDSPALADPGALVPRAFLCRGNEPFWALDITASSAVLKTPGSESLLAGELKAGETGAYAFRGAPDDSPGDQLSILMSPGQCFDTMADGPAMPFVALASFADGVEASGCCTVEYGLDLSLAPALAATAKAADDWSRHLPDLAGAVERCMLDAGVATDVVTVATPMNRGMASVRLRDAGNERFDCIIELGSNRIDSVGQVGAGDRLPMEGNPLLRPAGESPPILACGRVEQVPRGDGSLLGYLHYVDGCD